MRQKHCFRDHDECAHIWAQQKQEEGWTSGRKMFFEGKSIYSYGHHFEIARFIDAKTVLFTTRGYSPTTSKHKWAVRQSLAKSLKVYEIYSLSDHNANVDGKLDEFKNRIEKIRHRFNFSRDCAGLRADIKTTAEYVKAFKKDITPKRRAEVAKWVRNSSRLFTPDEVKKYTAKETCFKANSDVRRAAAEKARDTRLANERKANAERAAKWETERKKREIEENAYALWHSEVDALNKEAWQNGANVRLDFYDLPIMLRVKGKEIETSRGAYVDLDEARKL